MNRSQKPGYTKRWRRRWDKGYHQDMLLWIMMDYFIDFANWTENEVAFIRQGKLVRMIKLKRGQHFFTVKGLADFFNVPNDFIRSRIAKLKKIGFLSIHSTNHFSIATVLNYDKYQGRVDVKPNHFPNHSPTTPQPLPNHLHPPKEYNKNNKNKEKYARARASGVVSGDPQQIINQTIAHLNRKVGADFKPDIYVTQSLIIDRINEGATLDDFKAVIDKKYSQWCDDARMSGNLRPVTLFAADKFEGYLQEARRNGNKPKPARKLQGIELMGLGLDVLTKFGEDKFTEFCDYNNLTQNDIDSIRHRAGNRSP